ncbi:hypothetical protein CSA37_08255 [Candidatus Fermentibacteria bacterium]|nr:MAG: hypothetical protein CSA37_08255 [Candidatus Fermentibacteria bacterium]
MKYSAAIAAMLLTAAVAGACTLEEAVEIALSQRGDVAAARNEVESARWERNNARTWFLPRVSATLGYKQDHDIRELILPGLGAIPLETEWASSYGITAAIPIVAQGPAGASMASTALEFAESSLSAAEQDAVSDVVGAFYSVLLARMMNEVATEAMEIAREGYELTSLRYETGMASRFELLQSQVAMENRRPDSIAAAAALENAAAAFAVSLGYPESETVTVEGDLTDSFPVQLPSSLEEARTVMSSSSIELEMAAAMRKLGDDGVNLAASSFAPQLLIQTKYNFEAQVDDITEITADDYHRNWTVSAAVQVPIVNGLSDYSGYRSARYDRLVYQAQASDIENYSSLGLVASWNALEQARKTVEAAGSTVVQAEEGAQIAQVSYEAGMITRIEMDGAFLALTTARTNYASALYSLKTAEAGLARVMGILTIQ